MRLGWHRGAGTRRPTVPVYLASKEDIRNGSGTEKDRSIIIWHREGKNRVEEKEIIMRMKRSNGEREKRVE
jgi:hypothetical protein